MRFVLTAFQDDNGWRVFEFDGIADDNTRTKNSVRTDVRLIRTYGIRVQELPLLCVRFLENLEFQGQHTFTYGEEEMRQHRDSAALAEAARSKKTPKRGFASQQQKPGASSSGTETAVAALATDPEPTSAIPHLSILSGGLLIRNDVAIFNTLINRMRPFSGRWWYVKDHFARPLLDARLASSRDDSPAELNLIRRASTGTNPEAMVQDALERVLAEAASRNCNCLEIDEVRMHSFRNIRYASISGYARRFLAAAAAFE